MQSELMTINLTNGAELDVHYDSLSAMPFSAEEKRMLSIIKNTPLSIGAPILSELFPEAENDKKYALFLNPYNPLLLSTAVDEYHKVSSMWYGYGKGNLDYLDIVRKRIDDWTLYHKHCSDSLLDFHVTVDEKQHKDFNYRLLNEGIYNNAQIYDLAGNNHIYINLETTVNPYQHLAIKAFITLWLEAKLTTETINEHDRPENISEHSKLVIMMNNANAESFAYVKEKLMLKKRHLDIFDKHIALTSSMHGEQPIGHSNGNYVSLIVEPTQLDMCQIINSWSLSFAANRYDAKRLKSRVVPSGIAKTLSGIMQAGSPGEMNAMALFIPGLDAMFKQIKSHNSTKANIADPSTKARRK